MGNERASAPPPEPDRSLRAHIGREIKRGEADAQDPDNAGLPDLEPRVTTLYSHWFTRECRVCKLKFREGDRVRLCPECQTAYHDDPQYGLRCWTERFAGGRPCKPPRKDPIDGKPEPGCPFTPDPAAIAGGDGPPSPAEAGLRHVSGPFLRGLETVWRPYGDAQVSVVEPDDERIGLECPWCRYRLRPGDRVVKCPCGHCDTYFHNDIYRHLTCWDGWNGADGRNFCPTTCAPIEPPAPDGEEAAVAPHDRPV